MGMRIFSILWAFYVIFKNEYGNEAYDIMQEIIKLNPEHTITLYNIGQYFFKKEQYSEAVDYFHRALNSAHDTKHIYFNITYKLINVNSQFFTITKNHLAKLSKVILIVSYLGPVTTLKLGF